MKKFVAAISLFLLLGFLIVPAHAEIQKKTYQAPDIRKVFCGPVMNFKYCKCAFHGQYCDDIGMDSGSANGHVQAKFAEWIAPKKQAFFDVCAADPNSYFEGEVCVTCLPSHYRVGNSCRELADLCSDDPRVHYDVPSKECWCDKGWEWDRRAKVCVEKEEIIIELTWLDQEPSFIANGKEGSAFSLVVLDEETAENKDATLSVNLGTLSLTGDNKGYYEGTYTAPDLMESTIAKTADDALNITYTSADGSTRVKSVAIPLLTGQPFKVSYPGFESFEGTVTFTSPTATVTVTGFDGVNQFPLQGAMVELLNGESATTNSDGVAVLNSPQETTNSQPSAAIAILTLDPKVQQTLKGAMDKYLKIGQENPVIYNFLRDFGKQMAQAKDSTDAQKLIDGLRRTEYALYYIDRGQEIGHDSADNLGGAIKEAVWNVVDSIGNIAETAQAFKKKFPDNVGSKWIEKMTAKLDGLQSGAFDRLGKYFEMGIAKWAPNWKEPVSNLFSRMQSKVFTESGKLNFDEVSFQNWIADYFKEEQNKKTAAGLSAIAGHITSRDWTPLRGDQGQNQLADARAGYDQMMDKFTQSHSQDYNLTMTKAYADVVFDTVGTVSDFTAWKPFVTGVETFYKGVRSAYMDTSNMYSWFQTVGAASQNTEHSLNEALGDTYKNNRLQSRLLPKILPRALAAEQVTFMDRVVQSDVEVAPALLDYEVAGDDLEMATEFLEMTQLMAEIYPDQSEQLDALAADLQAQIDTAQNQMVTLQSQVDPLLTEINKYSNPLDENGDGEVTFADITFAEWLALGLMGLAFVGVILLAIKLIRRRKK